MDIASLKTCPFCGKIPSVRQDAFEATKIYEGDEVGLIYDCIIRCSGDDCVGPETYGRDHSSQDACFESAKSRWNKRV